MENQNDEWMSADIVKKEYEEDQKQNDEAPYVFDVLERR